MTQTITAIRSAIAQDRPVSTEDILALCDEVERLRNQLEIEFDIKRIETLSGEELDAELRAQGLDPDEEVVKFKTITERAIEFVQTKAESGGENCGGFGRFYLLFQ